MSTTDSDCIRLLTPAPGTVPTRFPSPFAAQPHPLAQHACHDLQQRLASTSGRDLHPFTADDGGKMFGVLVVRDRDRRVAYLSGFSGMLGGRWQVAGFVPPVFDLERRSRVLPAGEAALDTLTQRIAALMDSPERHELVAALADLTAQVEQARARLAVRHRQRRLQRQRQRVALQRLPRTEQAATLQVLSLASQHDRRERRDLVRHWRTRLDELQQRLATVDGDGERLRRQRARLSRRLQRRLFADYVLVNGRGEQRALLELFAGTLPPAGSGDCAAPKLLHYACQHGLQPLALAEFWWGTSPATGIRHHGHYYPACRGKCGPILPFMLTGIDVAPAPLPGQTLPTEPVVVYEDEAVLVVNKPAGLLSVPGKQVQDSVLLRLRRRYPHADGPLLVHRLDMATSGLLLAAKSAAVHKALQKQFIRRRIEKRYVALLDTGERSLMGAQGQVDLPLRVDLDDRPRQRVCYEHGKAATTRWRVIDRGHGQTRVYFYPLTGRTHQLRVHAAHRDGLAAPIVGDELYGRCAERLLLHAERLRFYHPLLERTVEVRAPVPF
jgi:tRNA pseudouridine32 synthase/23S rRNA pseudouridine746 synthase